jgi:hypothetical protein
MTDEEKTQRALQSMDRITDQWAIETNLLAFVAGVMALPDLAQGIEAIARQCFAEGAYRGFVAGREMTSMNGRELTAGETTPQTKKAASAALDKEPT